MTDYAFLTSGKFNAADWRRGHRFSLDGSEVVAKMAPGQVPPDGAVTRNHEETLAILAGPAWAEEAPK